PILAVAPMTVSKPRGTTQVVTRGILMIGVINAGGTRYCTRQYEKKVNVVNGVLASDVDMLLEKDLVGFALQEMKIHPLMLLTLSMIFQTFSPTLHNPSTNHTRASYVEMILTMYSINHQEDLNQQGRNDVHDRWDKMIESGNKLIQILGEMLREHAANISTHTPEPSRHFDSFYDDDDYKESTIPFNKIVS
ncbi:hypothetical protein Tco_1345815, partial [Tanacetum coccineum]